MFDYIPEGWKKKTVMKELQLLFPWEQRFLGLCKSENLFQITAENINKQKLREVRMGSLVELLILSNNIIKPEDVCISFTNDIFYHATFMKKLLTCSL